MENATVYSINVSVPSQGSNDQGYYLTLDIICVVLRFTLIFPICYGNSLVLAAVFKFRKLRTPTNVFITSLAISDLMVGLVTIPTFSLVHHGHLGFETQKYFCLISYTLSHGPTSVSMVTSFVIAWERYLAVHRPYWYERKFTMGPAAKCAVGVWIYVWIILPVLAFSTDNWTEDMDDCNFASALSTGYIATLLAHMLVILAVTTVLYILIARTALHHQRAIAKQRPSIASTSSEISRTGEKESKLAKNAKIAKMLSCVLGIFYLCWLPYFISVPFAIVNKADHDPLWLHTWEQLAGIVVMCNSFMNPLVYAHKNEDFRVAFKKLLKRKKRSSFHEYLRSKSVDTEMLSLKKLGGPGSTSATWPLNKNRIVSMEAPF